MSHHGSRVYFFGDSLTDVSVIFDALVDVLTAQILAGHGPNPTDTEIALARQQAETRARAEVASSNFGPENAVTNEFTHATYFGDVSGADVENFANAGARALGTQEPFGAGTFYDSNLGGQLARFVAATAGSVAPGRKAVLFIGANDYSDALGAALEAPDASVFDLVGAASDVAGDLLETLEGAARTLENAGVETIYFGTLPAATFFTAQDALDDLTAALSDLAVSIYNGLLSDVARGLRSEGIDVQVIDYAAVAQAIAEDPSGFGIVAEPDDLLFDGSAFDSDQVGFWDPVHPAEAVHQAWGAYAAFVMQGGSTASLSDFGTISVQSGGDNAVFANGGGDTILALGGEDIVFGGTGGDVVYAGTGDDIVSGGADDDLLRGGVGDDIVSGGSGDDLVLGGFGDDVLIDGLGNDTVTGGWGDDVFIFVERALDGGAGPGTETFRGGQGDDILYLVLDEGSFDAFGANGTEALLSDLGISATSIETVIGIDGRDGVESKLGGFSWFQEGDYWGLIPAPTLPEAMLV